jgi:outer membrane protein assembly factor BamB
VPKPAYCIPTNSYASPTPAIEAGRVYVHFGSYGTACLDTATGQKLWERRDLPCDHFRAPASSPILYKDLLYLTFDGFDFQYVVALDKKTGQTRWKRDRSIDYGTTNGDLKKAFSTPSIIQVGEHQQLVSPSAKATIAYDPESGDEVWKVYHGGMNASARPVTCEGLVLICPSDGGAYKMLAVRPEGHGDVTRSHIAWHQDKNVPNRSSILAVGDLLYMVSMAGVAGCLDGHDGHVLWQTRLTGGKEYYASPIFAEGRVYFFDTDGLGHVLTADRQGRILARNRLDDGCMASPAVAGKSLFVRTKTHLYRIENMQ